MKIKATQEDVARRAGVSVATVSYVMNGRKNGRSRIPDATKQLVLDAARELNYMPNLAARDLRRGKTDRICLVLPVAGAPVNNLLFKSVEAAIGEHGFFLVSSFGGSMEREYRIYQQLRRGFADGVIFFSNFYLDENHFNQLSAAGISVVAGSMLTSRRIPARGFDVIRSDTAGAQEEAIGHLLGRGHRRIAMIWDESNLNHVDRAETYLRILSREGVEIDSILLRKRVPDGRSAYEAVSSLLDLEGAPTAVLAISDRSAEGALNAAKDRQLRIPQDIAIVGFGNIAEIEITTPALTTIGPESWNLEVAADLLLSRLNHEGRIEGRTLEIPARFLVRASA